MTKTMTIARVAYIEQAAPTNDEYHPDGVCRFCALSKKYPECHDATLGAAEAAFGGDCETRDVVYAVAPKEAA